MTEERAAFGSATGRAFHAAHREALRRGRRSVEAEDLLVALAADDDSACGRLLGEFGLSHEALTEALERERARSLAYAGVDPLPPTDVALDRHRGPIRLGASARSAIRAGMKAAALRHRPRRATDLLLGILGAELGTVARAVAIAGIDRDRLVSALDERTGNRVAE